MNDQTPETIDPRVAPERYEALLRNFEALWPDLNLVVRDLVPRLADIARDLEIYPIAKGRAKSLESFAEKVCRPGKRYVDPLRELTDLGGLRLIVHTQAMVDRLAEAIGERFEVDEDNSRDARAALGEDQFGYLSRHLILKVEAPEGDAEMAAVLERIEAVVGTLRVELQIRTIAQHAYADVFHELGYKNEFTLPSQLRRDFARVAALLESCDQLFTETAERVDELSAPGFDSYMSDEALQALVARLEVYLRVEPKNASVLYRLLRAYKSLSDWSAMLALHAAHRAGVEADPRCLREVGVALMNAAEGEGGDREEAGRVFEEVLERSPKDVDTLCALGDLARKDGDLGAARDWFRQGYALAPSYTYAFLSFVTTDIRARESTAVLDALGPALDAAYERCGVRIDLEIDLPWAFFDRGLCALLLGDVDGALESYEAAFGGRLERGQLAAHLDALRDLEGFGVGGLDDVMERLETELARL